MKPEFIEDRVAQQGWVQPTERALSGFTKATLQRTGSAIRNFLHGTWLGHALHPAAVTVPIGAWTTAAALDTLDVLKGTEEHASSAQAAVGLGLATGAFAAASGLADWGKSDGDGRKVGVLHAVANGGSMLCYLASWLLRRRGERIAGITTGIFGWLLMGLGGYLGGRMVGNHRLGVDHAERRGPDNFTPVFPDSELPEGEPHRAEVNGIGILVVKQHGRILALGEKCAHLGGPLSEGTLEDGAIRCPWHGSKFDLETGKVLDGPSAYAQPCWEARVRNGQVEVRFVKKF